MRIGFSLKRIGWLLLFFLLSFFVVPLWAYDEQVDFLTAELWVELTPAVSIPTTDKGDSQESTSQKPEIFPISPVPLKREEAIHRLLEEAQFVISGMIYGYRLEYTPLDRSRGVSEVFHADPVATIPWGDPALRVLDTWMRGNKFFARIRYDLSSDQMLRLRFWNSGVHASASASAEAALSLGYLGRIEAHRQAIKQAFRDYLRSIEPNKPRVATGRVVLAEAPISAVSAGGYRSTVRIRIDLEDLHPYGAF